MQIPSESRVVLTMFLIAHAGGSEKHKRTADAVEVCRRVVSTSGTDALNTCRDLDFAWEPDQLFKRVFLEGFHLTYITNTDGTSQLNEDLCGYQVL